MKLIDMQIASARRDVNVALMRLRRHLTTAVEQRDGTKCRECGVETITLDQGHPRRRTLDHIIPQSLGGKDVLDNLQILCSSCNSSKGAKVDRSLLCPRCHGGRTLDLKVDYATT